MFPKTCSLFLKPAPKILPMVTSSPFFLMPLFLFQLVVPPGRDLVRAFERQ
jgi:hypothetical protein